jgi:suppressor of ftsI
VVRLRILNGSNALLFPLVLPGFNVYLIAHDGVNVLAPQLIDPSSNVQIASGNRAELLVQAPMTPGTYTLSALSVPDPTHPWPQFDLMQFIVSGTPVTMGIPASLPTPTRMYPPIADSEIALSRTITFSSAASTSILSGTALKINGNVYDEMAITANLQVGTAQRWTLVNTMSEGHPYHIHTNSFEVHSVTGPNGTTNYNPPYIADTVWIPPNGQVVIQSRYKKWRGKDVFHCHKLTHEDQGMMANTMLF